MNVGGRLKEREKDRTVRTDRKDLKILGFDENDARNEIVWCFTSMASSLDSLDYVKEEIK